MNKIKDEKMYEGLMKAAEAAARWDTNVDGKCVDRWFSRSSPYAMETFGDYGIYSGTGEYGWPAIKLAAVCELNPRKAYTILRGICDYQYTSYIDNGKGREVAKRFREEAEKYKPKEEQQPIEPIHIFL